MVDILYLGGLVVLVLGFLLYRLRQRRKWPQANLIFRSHIDASGNFMCFALSKRLPATPPRTDRT